MKHATGAERGPRSAPARKRFGQHFLEPSWVRKLLDVIRPTRDDLFLEIGPGTGQLTLPIAATGAEVVAVEIDRELAAGLRGAAPPHVRVITGDVLACHLPDLLAETTGRQTGRPVRVVGNLPYHLSSPILHLLLDTQRAHGCFHDATLMLQREVADRLVSPPGSGTYGPLAILTRLGADADRALTLPPGAFRPVPRVRSAAVTLRFRPPPVTIGDTALFAGMVRGLFTRRRKTLLNALGPFAETVSSLPSRSVVERAGLSPERRPETLDLEELARLAEVLADNPVARVSEDAGTGIRK